jgi:hypothetical protein
VPPSTGQGVPWGQELTLCDVPPPGQGLQGGGLAIVLSVHCCGHWFALTALPDPTGHETHLLGGVAEPPNVQD